MASVPQEVAQSHLKVEECTQQHFNDTDFQVHSIYKHLEILSIWAHVNVGDSFQIACFSGEYLATIVSLKKQNTMDICSSYLEFDSAKVEAKVFIF